MLLLAKTGFNGIISNVRPHEGKRFKDRQYPNIPSNHYKLMHWINELYHSKNEGGEEPEYACGGGGEG